MDDADCAPGFPWLKLQKPAVEDKTAIATIQVIHIVFMGAYPQRN
jgi:hypothetical protein